MVTRGPRGFRGPRGHMTVVSASPVPTGPNITTLDTTGLEESFQTVGDAMNQLAQQQQIANVQLNQSLQQQQHERGQMIVVMDKVGNATLQSSYNTIFHQYLYMMVLIPKSFGLGCIVLSQHVHIQITILIWKQWGRVLEKY